MLYFVENSRFSSIQILICDNYEKQDGTTMKNVYVESHLQLNFHTSSENENLIIRSLERQEKSNHDQFVRTIQMSSIRSIMYVDLVSQSDLS